MKVGKVSIHKDAGKGLTLQAFKETFGKILTDHDVRSIWKKCGGVALKKQKEADKE